MANKKKHEIEKNLHELVPAYDVTGQKYARTKNAYLPRLGKKTLMGYKTYWRAFEKKTSQQIVTLNAAISALEKAKRELSAFSKCTFVLTHPVEGPNMHPFSDESIRVIDSELCKMQLKRQFFTADRKMYRQRIKQLTKIIRLED